MLATTRDSTDSKSTPFLPASVSSKPNMPTPVPVSSSCSKTESINLTSPSPSTAPAAANLTTLNSTLASRMLTFIDDLASISQLTASLTNENHELKSALRAREAEVADLKRQVKVLGAQNSVLRYSVEEMRGALEDLCGAAVVQTTTQPVVSNFDRPVLITLKLEDGKDGALVEVGL